MRSEDTDRSNYFRYGSLMAWPLTRALIENLIHVKEDTNMCSGKISQTSTKPLCEVPFAKPLLQFDVNVKVCKNKTG